MPAQKYEIVLDDQLQWVRVPLPSKAALAAAAESKRQRLFEERWVEKADSDQPDDLDRFLEEVRTIAAGAVGKKNRELATRTMLSAHSTVCLDHDRRIAFGQVRPPPKSIFGVRDGGVDTRRYRHRRHRPDGAHLKNKVTGLPRCHSDIAATCLAPEPSQFDSGSIVVAGLAKLGEWTESAHGRAGIFSEERVRRNRKQALSNAMRRSQPKGSTVYQALRLLVGIPVALIATMVVIDIVRHAEGWHNIAIENQRIQDPVLTDRGEKQCDNLRATYPHGKKLNMLVASPMQRTLQTCILSFGELAPSGTIVVAIPELQELSTLPSDVGSDPSVLHKLFGDQVDFSRVKPGWNNKSADTPFEPTIPKIEARARKARCTLRELTAHLGGDDHIAVVSHGAFLHFLTEDFHGVPPERATGWENTEYRSYVFADPTGADENATLQEMAESRIARLGHNDSVDQDSLKKNHIEVILDQMAQVVGMDRGFKFQ
ncbi:phosphoglycerate mutase family protein [Grosmannia clavigera kw1407]|uniref:Phosphoglycerate mutase family protein n=1 Tax=Grosmannia clavigera (strain kw1407 / UAMH 11150) TaxID=655863 RepID=F0XLU2_GROCL|nr:phosphoglycerate mutase family protein [Grosmannia clavigera kw1407]EFX01479.1 phosphoglycerate mutase family protein [Grosmannia clavigera kw1407]